MAHLTKSNLGKLCQKLKINNEIDLDIFVNNIYNDKEIYYILNRIEIEYLFKYKMMLDNEDEFFAEYFEKVAEKEDSKTFVFNKGGKMKYHLSSDCKLLKKDYLDFAIPQDIQDLGDKDIEEYRDWFRDNNFADRFKNKTIGKDLIIKAFNDKYTKEPYNIKKIEDNSNLLIVEIPNSSIRYIEKDYNKVEFIKKITELKKQFQNIFQCKISRKLSKFKYLLKMSDLEIKQKIDEVFVEGFTNNYGIENLKEKFKVSKGIVYEIISLLLEYIRWNYKANDKDFNILTLEKFGLECCISCEKESKNVLQPLV
jgi:hypothetical protein